MLSVENVTKRYGKFTVLEDINLMFENGVYGLLAPNGAGKTTLIKMLTTLLFPTEGRILWDGQDILTMDGDYRGLLGYLPQEFGYYKNYSPRQFLRYMASLQGLNRKEVEGRIDELLELVFLTEVKDKKMKQFSGGMIQRVGIAQAMLNNPKLLILDEPASGLDPRARVEMKEVLKQLKTLGKTIVISSHILPELAEMCTEIGIIDRGCLAAQGTVQEILKQLTQKRIIYVRPLENLEGLLKLLQEQPLVENIFENIGDAEFEFNGNDQELSSLLKRMVDAHIPVLSFKEKDGNLEEIFMQVTGGNAK